MESPLRRPDLFRRLGPRPSPWAFFSPARPGRERPFWHGAVAKRTNAAFFHVAGPEIMSKHLPCESEAALRACVLRRAASRSAPGDRRSIHEIDAICARDEWRSSSEKAGSSASRGRRSFLTPARAGWEHRRPDRGWPATNLPTISTRTAPDPGFSTGRSQFATTPGAATARKSCAFHFPRGFPWRPGSTFRNIGRPGSHG